MRSKYPVAVTKRTRAGTPDLIRSTRGGGSPPESLHLVTDADAVDSARQDATPSPSAAMPPEVSLEGVTVCYGDQPALRDVNLVARSGKITALVGPSGCGKSTLLAAICRMLDLVPSSRIQGRICVGPTCVSDARVNVRELRRLAGFILQRPTPFPTSIWENLAFPLRDHGVRDNEEIEQRIQGALGEVGLWSDVSHRLRASASTLSGGQKQRLCIARAVVLRPKVLLFDEPTSALDPLSAAVVEELIKSLRPRYTVLMSTHNLAQARRLADDVAVFWCCEGAGYITDQGCCDRVFSQPATDACARYLGGLQG